MALKKPADPDAFCAQIGFAPDDWQMEVVRAEKNLVLNTSRQAGKSTAIAARLLYRATQYPDSLALITSPTEQQSRELLEKVRRFYDEYRLGGAQQRSLLSMRFDNGSRIVALSGKPQSVRGFSGLDTLVVDEAAYAEEELFHAVTPMLATSSGQIILASTPNKRRGFFYEAATNWDNWQRITVPADIVPRIPSRFLEAERERLPEPIFRREYFCEFLDSNAFLFDIANIEIIDIAPPLERVIRFYDLAITAKKSADYTAGVKLGITSDEKIIVLDVLRGQMQWPDVKRRIIDTALADGRNCRVRLEGEKTGIIGTQELLREKALRGFVIDYKPPAGDKYSRALPVAARVNAGRIAISRAGWNRAFLDELSNFDGAGHYHDDQVDALSGAYDMLTIASDPVSYNYNPFFR